jgi:hypothetical protein
MEGRRAASMFNRTDFMGKNLLVKGNGKTWLPKIATNLLIWAFLIPRDG